MKWILKREHEGWDIESAEGDPVAIDTGMTFRPADEIVTAHNLEIEALTGPRSRSLRKVWE